MTSLSSFSNASFSSTWVRSRDGMEFGSSGSFTSLMFIPFNVEPVPESSALLLFLAAALVARKRTRAS